MPRKPDRKPSRICQLVHSLNIGGAEMLAAQFARKLGGPERIVFACLDDLGPLGMQLRDEGFAVEVLGRRPGFDIRCARRLARYLDSESVGLVHAHQYTPFFQAALSRGWRRSPAILFTEHGRFYPDYPRRKRMFVNPWLLQPRDHITAVGECVRTALVDNEGLPRDRIEVVYNGIDVDHYGNSASDREVIRRQLGIASDDIAVLTVARFDSIKDHATSLRAMKPLLEAAPNVRLLLAGDGPERANLESLHCELGLGDRVRFLGMRRDVPQLLAAADIFLLNSLSEGIPLTLIEAMAARLPAVVTQVGGMPEVVADGVIGYLVEAGAAPAIADRLVRLATNPELRAQMGEQGRQLAFARFSERAMMARYEQIYQDMMSADLRRGTDERRMAGILR